MVPRMNRHWTARKVSVQVAHRLLLLIGQSHGPQLPRPMQPRQHRRNTPVRLHPLSTATGARPDGPRPAVLPFPEVPGSICLNDSWRESLKLWSLRESRYGSPPAACCARLPAAPSAPTVTQSPWRLPSAGFAGVDFPIAHTARLAVLTARGGFGSHTPRSKLQVRAVGAYGVPSRALAAPMGATFLLDRAVAPRYTPIVTVPRRRGHACRSPLHGRPPPLHSRSTILARRSSPHPATSRPILRHNPPPWGPAGRFAAPRTPAEPGCRSP